MPDIPTTTSPLSAPFYVVSGTLPLDSQSYVPRQADKDLLSALLACEYCFVLNSRQMGKSSLAVRTMAKLQEAGVKTVFLDLTKIGGSNVTPEQWYIGLLSETGRALGLRKEFLEYWKENSEYSLIQRYIAALHDVTLGSLAAGHDHHSSAASPSSTGPSEHQVSCRAERSEDRAVGAPNTSIVLFIDEIDAVKSLSFSTDEFFAAIRECYNRRVQEPEYGRLAFALVGSATASDLIQDTRTSPFNIGKRIELKDFTLQEMQPLAEGLISRRAAEPRRGESHKDTEAQKHTDNEVGARLLDRVFYWTNGHPFLTQALCAEIAAAQSVQTPNAARSANAQRPGSLVRRADSEDQARRAPPLVDALVASMFFEAKARERNVNLADVSNRILSSYLDADHKEEHRAAILDLYGKVLNKRTRVADDETNRLVAVLKLSGITTSVQGELRVRNRIYERVFDRAWTEQNMPDAELRRQKGAYRRGMLRTAAIATLLLIGFGALAFTNYRSAKRANALAGSEAKQREEAQHLLYVADMNLIRPNFEQNNFRRVLALLEETKNSRHRGIEWGYWNRLCHLELLMLSGHSGITASAFSHDGRRIVTGSDNGAASVWNAYTGQPLLTLRGHSARIYTASFSPDDTLIRTASIDGTLRVWDADTGLERTRIVGDGSYVVAAFSVNGKYVSTYTRSGLKTWDVDSGLCVATSRLPRLAVAVAAFSPDCKQITIGGFDNGASLWNIATGRKEVNLDLPSSQVYALAFSPDGRRICAGVIDSSVWVMDAKTGRKIFHLTGHVGAVYSVAFSNNGKQIVTGSMDNTARIWDASTGHELLILKGHLGTVRSVAFSPDDRRVISGSDDRCARVWDATANRAELVIKGHTGLVDSASFSLKGNCIVTAGDDGTAKVWDADTGLNIRTLTLTRNAGTPVHEADTGLTVTALTLRHDEASSAAFSPDGKHVVIGSGSDVSFMDPSATVWDVSNGRKLKVFEGHLSSVLSVAFSPDGKHIVTASADKTARVWDVDTRRDLPILRGHTDKVRSALYSPDGKHIVTASDDHTAKVWNSASGNLELTLSGHTAEVFAAVFSPDGKRIVTGSNDCTAIIWDAATGSKLRHLEGHSQFVWSAVFSPDGTRIATGSADHTAKIWNSATGDEVLTLTGHSDGVRSVAFSPDGKRIVTASADGTARVWYFDDKR